MTHPSHAEGNPGGIAPEDLPHLRRCVELAAEAVDAGDHPFGSVLVAADGRALAEDRNRENTMGDATRHPEFELARWAAANMTAADRRRHRLHLGRALPDVRGRARLGRARPHRVRELVRAADGVAGRAGRAAVVPGARAGGPRRRSRPTVQGPVPELAGQVRELHRRFRS